MQHRRTGTSTRSSRSLMPWNDWLAAVVDASLGSSGIILFLYCVAHQLESVALTTLRPQHAAMLRLVADAVLALGFIRVLRSLASKYSSVVLLIAAAVLCAVMCDVHLWTC